ncbi:MAG: aminotransferase class III-fold pyridoxal phosphate-dependent enzyme [Betaproteobacteria bacterium]
MNAPDQAHLALGARTQDLAERAARVMPGRQSNLRAQAEPSVFIERALGQRMWDVDGRQLIDFAIGMGPGIWGHGNREYQDALHEQLEKVFVVASGMLQTENEVLLAECITTHVPCADRVRFVTTGSEAVQMVVRLARAFTGRHKFVRFEGHYHGWLDNVLGGRVNEDASAEPFAVENPADPMHTEGRSEFAMRESFKIPWNDIDALGSLLKHHGKDIALVLMEAVMTNGGCCIPRPGYLERVRELCTQYGVVLCMDEVITGFRMGLGGAQAHYGVTPDLSSFGKAIAGGMALAAVAGRAEIFELLRTNTVVGAGTFNAAPMSMTAGLTTLRMLERGDGAVYRHIDELQTHFMTEFRRLGRKHGHDLLVQGVRGVFCAHFSPLPVAYSARDLAAHADRDKARRLRLALIAEGVYPGRGDRYFVSAGLTAADLEDGLSRIDRALARI